MRLNYLLRLTFFLGVSLLFFNTSAFATEIVLTLPFENVTNRQEYNWVRESFTVSMSNLLDSPGIIALGLGERNLAFEKLGISNTAVLTRATEIKLGEAANADLLIRGTYSITGEGKEGTLTVRAQIISIREGKFLGTDHVLSGPLSELQLIQGRLAWELLYQRNMALPFSKDQLITRATGLPPPAYEYYVKALLTSTREEKIKLLFRALGEIPQKYQPSSSPIIYELASLYYNNKQYNEAKKWYEKIETDDPRGLEARFQLGVCKYELGQIDDAGKEFSGLLSLMPLYEVYNNAGIIQLQQKNLPEGIRLIKLAAETAPQDFDVQFNCGYAFWQNGNYKDAALYFEKVVKANPKSGKAFYLLSKSLQNIDQRQSEAATFLNEAKKFLPEFAKWETSGKIPILTELKHKFNRDAFYRYLHSKEQDRQANLIGSTASRRIEDLMSKAQTAFLNNKDEEALLNLSQILQIAPDNSDAHLLMGRVNERKGELVGAINALRAAVFWNPKLIGAHILLGRIYFGQQDRKRAEAHLKLALEIKPDDRESLALQRLIQGQTQK